MNSRESFSSSCIIFFFHIFLICLVCLFAHARTFFSKLKMIIFRRSIYHINDIGGYIDFIYILFIEYLLIQYEIDIENKHKWKNGVKHHVFMLKEKVCEMFYLLNKTMWVWDILNLWLSMCIVYVCFFNLVKSRYSRNIYMTQFSAFPMD